MTPTRPSTDIGCGGVCAAWSLCSAKRLFHLRPQIDLILSAAKSALGLSRHLAALQSLVVSAHSGLWQAVRTADLWVRGLEEVVQEAIGSSGLMEFVRFDAGEVLRKERDGQGPKILRLVVGNPLIMKEMAKAVPDAAAYAPVTILVDERADGVHLSYDSMASFIAPYGSEAALAVARDLDAKIETLLKAVAK